MSRILPLLGNTGNRRVLSEWLTHHTDHEVLDVDEDEPLARPVDLCIIDGPALEDVREELRAYREQQRPEFVPVLLLVPRAHADRLEETVWNYVDDIIWTSGSERFDSLDTFEFEGRMRSLLRTREMSRELKQNQERLKVLHRVLRHNVRNSLNVIRGNAEVIEESGGPDAAARIIKQSDRLLNHAEKAREIDTILEDGSEHRIDLGRHVEQTAERYRQKYPAAEITLDVQTDVRVTAIDGITQAFGELIDNAIVHDSRDSPEVTVRVAGRDGCGAVVIADTGPAISDKDRRILSGDRDPTAVDHGQGVGLWLVVWAVRRADGTIEYERRESGGNRITVLLPEAE